MGSWPDYVKGSSGSAYAPCSTCAQQPNPTQFKFLRMERKGDLTLAEVQYTNCTNYEGKKIIIMKINDLELVNLRSLDPHFSKNSKPEIIARFQPTEVGWMLAKYMFESLADPNTFRK